METQIKAAVEELGKSFEAFKKANDAALTELKSKGFISAETQAKVDRLDAAVTGLEEKLQGRVDEVERRLNRGQLSGGDIGEALAKEVEKFNATLRSDMSQRGMGSAFKPLGAEQYKAYKAGFMAWARGGEAAIDGVPEFRAAMSVGSDPQGGYLVPADITGRIIEFVYETSPLRGYANIRTTNRDRVQGPNDLDQVATGWVAESASRPVTASPKLGRWEIPVHEQYAMPQVSQNDLDDADFDIETWLTRKIADKLGRSENLAFVGGDGVSKPRGFTTYGAGTPSATTFNVIQRIATGKAGAFADAPNGPDLFVDMMGSMKENYLNERTIWAMTRTTLAVARKLKDSYGHYQVELEPGLTGKPGFALLGYPVVRLADMAEIGANSLSVAFGDFYEAYQIVDRQGIRMIRDNLTVKGQVLFYTTKRVGGDVLNFDALKLGKFAAS